MKEGNYCKINNRATAKIKSGGEQLPINKENLNKNRQCYSDEEKKGAIA